MEFNRWQPFYERIRKEFGFSEEEDRKAAHLLDSLLDEKDVGKVNDLLEERLKGKDIFVCGAGPSLTGGIKLYRERLERAIAITADGATSAFLAEGLIPDVIVTDLDGYVPDQIRANSEGSMVIVHAHGDNIDALREWVKIFDNNILGTAQCDVEHFKNLFNFGGFTDGDRAAFLAEHYGARKIFLIGFDFDGKIGKYSFTNSKNLDRKREKLAWCKILLREIKKSETIFL